jgi:hypothetical protein
MKHAVREAPGLSKSSKTKNDRRHKIHDATSLVARPSSSPSFIRLQKLQALPPKQSDRASADLPASAWRFLLVVGFTAAVVSPAPGATLESVKNAQSKARNRLLCQLPVNDSAKLA